MHEAGEAEIPALLLAIAIVALVSLGIFHRAKAISARNLEIRKLQRLAAEEVARVEAAAAEEYTSMLAISNNFASCTQSETSHSLMKQSAPTITDAVEKHVRAVDNIQFTSSDVCIVCSTPTSRRCSRCKLVKYCSTDCQVLHWREGHKLECRAPETPPSENKTLLAGASPDHAKQIVANNPESCISFVEEKPAPARTPRTLAIAAPDGSLLKPSKILFPYEYFVEYFHWDRLPLTPCGLINCGNSCFANVVLQCLTYTRPLAAYLLQGNHTEECRRIDWCFMCELQSHVFRVKESQSPFSPIRILSRIQNIGNHLGYGRQEDAHEFMRFAIDSMQSICLDEVGGEKAVDPRTQETTFIQHIFGGHLQSQVKCMQCHHESDRYENMMDLAVEIQGNVESLEDALAQFTTPEWLDGENKYKCDRCNAYVKARKHLTVHEAPNILMIALKRFQSGKFGKLNKRVSFPEVLDMSPYMSGKGDMPPRYQLYAVVVHVDMLNASFFGHYICYVKDLHGSWYKVDDSNVKEVDLEKVMQQKAYMLLYTRSVPRPPPDVDGSGKSSTPVLVNDSCRLGTKFPNGAYSRAPDMPFRSTLSNGVSKANGSISSLAGGTGVASCEVPNMCLREDSCSLNVSSLTNLRGVSTEGCQSTSYDESSDIYSSDGMKNLAICSTNPSCHLLEFKSSLEVITNLVQLPEGMCESHLPVAFPEKTGKQGAEKIGKHGVCSGLSPLPTPKPLGTDRLPTWPAASHNRSFSCPAVIHSSLEHVSSSILVPDTCRPQRKRIKGEVGFSNPVRPLHLKKMEVLEPADSLNSVAYSQHKIKRGILASPLQHNGETYACISEVIEGAGSSEISMDVGSGVIARDLPASQHGVAELSLNLENLNNEDHYDHLSTINGDLAILDEYQKQATANMVDWVAPVDMACVINHRPDLCQSQSVEELDLVNMAANMAKTSESSEFPSFDTLALEDSCTGTPSYVYSEHLSDECNEDHLQGVGRFSSRREFNSTNSDESGIASTSESGFLPSLAGLFEVPSQKASLTFLGGRSTVRNPPDHSVIINEMSNTEPGDKMLELKPMFKPGFLNRSVRHQPRIKSGDEKANGVVTGCPFPNRSSSFGNGISADNSSTYSSGGLTSGIEMGSTGVPCASADDKVGSRDEVALRQVVNAKSRCMDTIVTSNTGDSYASMGSEVQSFADVGTSETLSERETPVTGDRDIENSRCAISFSNNSIPTAVNGTFLISEPRNQQSGSRIPQDLTDETMQSLKDNMQNQTLCANRRKPKIGSNESCTCGSHEKWKKCCGRAEILGRHLVV